MNIRFFFPTLFLLTLFVGCNVGPNYPYPENIVPEEWKRASEPSSEMEEVCHWWEIFEDDKLNRLIEQALGNNYSLKAAIERIIQARAEAGMSGSDLYPHFNAAPSYNNETFLNKAFGAQVLSNSKAPVPLFRQHQITYSLPFNLSWELDLWGRLKNIYCSAVYHAEAEYEAFADLALVLTTDLADRYFRIRSLDQQLDLFLKTIETRKKALKVNQDRYEYKIINYDPVSQARLDLANVEADYYEAKRLRESLENSIATLIGVPSSLFYLEHHPLTNNPPPVLASLPSEVLLRRPDIRQLERERASTHALVRAAYGAYFPSFSLTSAIGFLSPDLKYFLSARSKYWSVGTNAFQTIFDAGYLDSNLKLQWARFNEADENYKQSVLLALEEVNTSLSDIEWFYQESNKLQESVEAANITYRIAFDRYIEGIGLYLAVVDSERDLLNAERALNAVRGQRYTASIQLIKALGGTW